MAGLEDSCILWPSYGYSVAVAGVHVHKCRKIYGNGDAAGVVYHVPHAGAAFGQPPDMGEVYMPL